MNYRTMLLSSVICMGVSALIAILFNIGEIQNWNFSSYHNHVGSILRMINTLTFHGSFLLFFLGLYQKTN